MKARHQLPTIRVRIGSLEFDVNPVIWDMIESKAGDKKLSLLTLAPEYIKEGKTAERALADSLSVFKLT